ncbi:MAG: hypothetical protein H7645_06455 [Candidatus Heimdallarchaeota archaeon]|nr:hypothetical protein [Candidatus Heimdallarchaeota archaeon]
MKNSSVLLGRNLKNDFILKEIWCYHSINRHLDKLEEVEELIENYRKYSESKILLYEISKRFIIILELLSEESQKVSLNKKELYLGIFNDGFYEIKSFVKGKRNWISIYESKGRYKEFGFSLLSILKQKKQTSKKNVELDSYLTRCIAKIRELGNECLDLIQV